MNGLKVGGGGDVEFGYEEGFFCVILDILKWIFLIKILNGNSNEVKLNF